MENLGQEGKHMQKYRFILRDNLVYVYLGSEFRNTYPSAWYASILKKKIRIAPIGEIYDSEITLTIDLNQIDGAGSQPQINTTNLETAIQSFALMFRANETANVDIDIDGEDLGDLSPVLDKLQSMVDILNQINSTNGNI